MTAGMNMKFRVWKITNDPDDRVGGALLSGTIIYDSIDGRISQSRPSYLLLQQGVEVESTWTIIARPITLQIKEQDEIEISYPTSHPHYKERFLVKAVQQDNIHPDDSRNNLLIFVNRRRYAHTY